MRDGQEKAKKDFQPVTSLQEFIDEMKIYRPKFLQHHERAKWQNDDIAFMNKNLKPGEVTSVTDFSEDLTIERKLAHHS